jgi:ABC-type enterobactin transport system permease subunit
VADCDFAVSVVVVVIVVSLLAFAKRVTVVEMLLNIRDLLGVAVMANPTRLVRARCRLVAVGMTRIAVSGRGTPIITTDLGRADVRGGVAASED